MFVGLCAVRRVVRGVHVPDTARRSAERNAGGAGRGRIRGVSDTNASTAAAADRTRSDLERCPDITVERLELEAVSANAVWQAAWWPSMPLNYSTADQAISDARVQADTSGLIHRVLVDDNPIWASDGFAL